MIKGIISTNPYISIGSAPTPYINMGTPSAGMLRYNGNIASIEVYDGSYWQSLSSVQDINLTPQANEILDWARKKMQAERDREILSRSHPAIFAALENLRRAEEQLETTIHLSKEHEKTTS